MELAQSLFDKNTNFNLVYNTHIGNYIFEIMPCKSKKADILLKAVKTFERLRGNGFSKVQGVQDVTEDIYYEGVFNDDNFDYSWRIFEDTEVFYEF